MITPIWALSVTYWLHMLATVVWIGSLAALSLLVLPAAQKVLDAGAFAKLLDAIQRRLDPTAWICLLVLAGTGLFQMSASPSYQGFLSIRNTWAAAILIKHLVFLVMIAISAYLTWGLLPRLKRAALLQARGKEAPDKVVLHQQEVRLLNLNLILGALILALTAVARAS
jgi:uncharacterized membrane protein